jgi:DNA-binding GntR family transcriptional regulator
VTELSRHPLSEEGAAAAHESAPSASPQTLAEQLFHRLTDAILKGELPLGSKISEPVLAERYGVSRGPLREALHRLQERHLITRIPNQGPRVTEATPAMLQAIYGVREVLEGLAAREAAQAMTVDDVAALADGVRRHEAEIAGREPGLHNALGSSDRDFHFRIARAAGNPILIDLLCNQFHPLLRLYRSRQDSLELRARALVEHQRILAAIQDHDPDMAELAMRRHIRNAGQRRAEAMAAAAYVAVKKRIRRKA